MRALGVASSGCGSSLALQAFAKWAINARRTGEFDIASPLRWFTTRSHLAMPRNMIARPLGPRKTFTTQIPTSATYRILSHEWKPTPIRVGSAGRGSQRAPPSVLLKQSKGLVTSVV
jgi:hypothetical protein